MTAPEQCSLHADKLVDIDIKVKEIHEALMGTLTVEGFISTTNHRLGVLESFKKTQNWIAKVSIGGFITMIIGSLWFILTGIRV